MSFFPQSFVICTVSYTPEDFLSHNFSIYLMFQFWIFDFWRSIVMYCFLNSLMTGGDCWCQQSYCTGYCWTNKPWMCGVNFIKLATFIIYLITSYMISVTIHKLRKQRAGSQSLSSRGAPASVHAVHRHAWQQGFIFYFFCITKM